MAHPEGVTVHGTSTGRPMSAGRLALLLVVLVGFLAMHGLSATEVDGPTHHSPLTLAVASHSSPAASGVDLAPMVPSQGTGDDSQRAVVGSGAGADHADDSDGAHGALAGCLLALTGLAAIVLLVRGHAMPARSVGDPAGVLFALRRASPQHPPLRSRSRTALCVIRV